LGFGFALGAQIAASVESPGHNAHIDYRGFMSKLMIDIPEHRCLSYC
jgi:hypothetical protein